MEKLTITQLINPQPKQLEALQVLLAPECKYLLYGGAMSGGKSYLLRWGAIAYALYLYRTTGIKHIPIGLFSEDYPTLKDRQIGRIEREFPKWLGELKDTKIDGLCFNIAEEYGGGKILLRNLDDPSKYMSTEFAGEFVEELTRNPKQTFMDLRNRLRYPGIDEVKFMGASNPGGVGHGWVKRLFITRKSEDNEQDRFFYVHANAYDNKYISKEYIKQLESLPPQQRKAYLEGSWEVFAGQYFDMWNSKHVINPFVPHDSLIVGGLDWGSAHPFAFYLSTVDKVFFTDDNNDTQSFYRVKTFFEAYGTRKTPEEWSQYIKELLRTRFSLTLSDISWVMADPTIFNKGNDMSMSIADQFIHDDERWRLLKPAKNDRIPGWAYMMRWMANAPDGFPYWRIGSNCTNAIRTIPELIHDENNVEDVETNRKGHIDDDPGDACRYMLRNIKLIDAFTGQIKSKKYRDELEGHQAKFSKPHEDASQLLIVDLDKFKKSSNSHLI